MCSNLNGQHTLNSSCWGRPREGCECFCLFSKHWWRFGRWEEPLEILWIILEDFSLPGCHPDISQKSLTVDVHGWWSGFYFFLLFPADRSARLGLPLLRGVKNPVPRCSDADPPQRGPDPTGPVAAGRLPDLQADDTRPICGQLPRVHAGTGENPNVSTGHPTCLKRLFFIYNFYFFFYFFLTFLENLY